MTTATLVSTATPAAAAVGGDPSAEAVALAEAARTGHRVEVTAEDSETETVFANPDGSLTSEVSPVPIRVRDEDGQLVAIDQSLQSEDGRLAPAASPAEVTFSASGNGALAALDTPGDTSFGMGSPLNLDAPSVSGDSATYQASGADTSQVEVRATSAGFSAHVNLPSVPATAPIYTFPLQLDGLSATLNNNQLILSNAAGEVVATSAPLQMWDSHLDTAGDPDHVETVTSELVSTAGGGTALQLTPSMDFLTDSSTVYPVTVDPDVSSVSRQADTYAFSGDADANFASSYSSRTGSTDGSNKYRSYEKFFIDKYMGKNIESATLHMYQYFAGTCTSRVTNLFPISDDPQTSSITWNNKPTVVTDARWSTQLTGNTGSSGCGGGAMQNMDVTKMLNGYTAGALKSDFDADGDNNTGDHVATIVLQAANEGAADSDKRFCSFNAEDAAVGHNCNPTSADDGRAASLSLTYLPDLGEKSFYSMTSHKLNDHSTLKINNDNGNALIESNDVDIKGRGMDLSVKRYYNAQASTTAEPTSDLSMGAKWSLSVGSDVRLWKRSDYRYDYVSASGAVYAGFVRKSGDSSDSDYNKFSTPSGSVGADLVYDTGNSVFQLTMHKSQTMYVFKKVDPNSDDFYLYRQWDRSDYNMIQYNYVAGGHQLASITDTTGRNVSVTYTNGVITQITDANGPTTRTWKYGYTNGLLTTYTDPASKVTTYGWGTGSDPKVTSVTDPVNQSGSSPRVAIGYNDSTGQATSIMYASDASSGQVGYTVNYYVNGQITNPCDTSKDDSESIWHSTNTATGDTTYCFRDRSSGATRDAMTHKVYDGKGNSRSDQFTIDSQPTSSTDAKGNTTVSKYGGGELSDRLGSVSDPKDSGATNGSKSSMTYGYVVDKNNNGLNDYSFDGYKYAPSATTDGNGLCTAYKYDTYGRLTDSFIDTGSGCNGETQDNADGRRYHQDFNADGTVSKSYDPDGDSTTAYSTVYTYWATGDTGYVTGTAGMVKTVQKPGGNCVTGTGRKLCTSYTYDGLSRIKTMTDGRGKVTTYSYDPLDRTTQVLLDGATTCTPSAGTCVTYTYDNEGNLTRRVDARGTSDMTYNRLNRQLSVATPDSSTVSYTYNDEGKLSHLGVSVQGATAKTWDYKYDNALLVKEIDIDGTSTAILQTHDQNSRLDRTTFPTTNAVTISRGYTNAGRPQNIDVTRAGDVNGTAYLPDVKYGYQTTSGSTTNDTNQVQKITVSGSSATINRVTNYTYGGFDRLSQANDPDNANYTYDYDAAFNMNFEQVGGTIRYYGYDHAGQLCWSLTTTTTATPNSPSPALANGCPATQPTGTTKVNQDAAGNGQGTSSTPLSYNAYNQVSDISGRTQGYNDLGNNLRVQTGTGISLVNSSLGVIARKTSAGITYYTRTPDGKILGETDNTSAGTYYFVTDKQDSVTTLVNNSGTRAGYYFYSPYGNPNILEDDAANAAANNPWRYIGGYYDIEGDGYTKLGARYYDNRSHFTQPDPQPGSLNDPLSELPYTYGYADPMNHADPSGRDVDIPGLFYEYGKAVGQGLAEVGRTGLKIVKPSGELGLACYVYNSASSGDTDSLQDDWINDVNKCFNPFAGFNQTEID